MLLPFAHATGSCATTFDPWSIDVNIHPTKNEIKFEDEAAIWQIVAAAVREALGRFNAMPGIDFDTADSFDIPVFNPNANGEHGVEIDATYNPFSAHSAVKSPGGGNSGGSGSTPSIRRAGIDRDWQKLYEGFIGDAADVSPLPADEPKEADLGALLSAASDSAEVDDGASSIQVRNKYILSPSISGVMVIDQHRAHVKVLFERYKNSLLSGNIGIQQVLFPEVLHLSSAQNGVLKMIEPKVREMGFDISYLGADDWSIVAVPSVLGDANPSEILMDVIDEAASGIDSGDDALVDKISLSMARSAAITAGRRMTDDEREHLIGELLRLPTPNYTPDGLPVIRMISEADLEKLFD